MSQNFVTPPSEAPPFVTASAFAQYSVAARLPPLESPRSPDESESDDDEPGFEQLENFQPGVPAAQALPFQPTAMPAVPCAPGLPAAIATPTTPAPAPASSGFLHSEIVADAHDESADDKKFCGEEEPTSLHASCESRRARRILPIAVYSVASTASSTVSTTACVAATFVGSMDRSSCTHGAEPPPPHV